MKPKTKAAKRQARHKSKTRRRLAPRRRAAPLQPPIEGELRVSEGTDTAGISGETAVIGKLEAREGFGLSGLVPISKRLMVSVLLAHYPEWKERFPEMANVEVQRLARKSFKQDPRTGHVDWKNDWEKHRKTFERAIKEIRSLTKSGH